MNYKYFAPSSDIAAKFSNIYNCTAKQKYNEVVNLESIPFFSFLQLTLLLRKARIFSIFSVFSIAI